MFKSKFLLLLIIPVIFFSYKFFLKENSELSNINKKIEQKKQPEELIFGWITDVHLGDNNHDDKLATLGHDAIERIMPKIIDHKAGFVVVTGDMIDNFHKSHDEVIEFHKEVKSLFEQYSLKKYFVIGNHDVQTTTKKEVKEIYGLEKENYVFQRDGVTFIVIDQQFNPDGTSYDDGQHYIPGALHQNQLNWVSKELEKAPGKIIILTHQPIFSVANKDGSDGVEDMLNGQKFQDILEKSGKVLAVLSGHRQPNKDEFRRTFGSVQHFILPSAIFKDTRLSYGIIKVDLKNYEVSFDYYMDDNQQSLVDKIDKITEKCKGKNEEKDYYNLLDLKESNLEKFNQIQMLFKKYKDTDFRNSQNLSSLEIQELKDFEDYNCYAEYLKLRKEFSGY